MTNNLINYNKSKIIHIEMDHLNRINMTTPNFILPGDLPIIRECLLLALIQTQIAMQQQNSMLINPSRDNANGDGKE